MAKGSKSNNRFKPLLKITPKAVGSINSMKLHPIQDRKFTGADSDLVDQDSF
jgi:hypothetical protein